MANTDTTNEETTNTGDMASTGEELTNESEQPTDETVEPTDGGETGVDPVIMEQLEAQAEASISWEELTDEDIKLIEDILKQITDSVQE